MESTISAPNRSKILFFIDNFATKFLVLLPYTIYHVYLIYHDDFKAIPYLIFVGLSFVGLVNLLVRFDFDLEFFKNPIDVFWNKNLPDYRKLYELKFSFDETNLGKSDLYAMTGVLTVIPIIGSVGTMVINYVFDKPIIQLEVFFPFLIFPTFGLILFFVAYLPAWKIFQRFKKEGNVKPYWYCFSYQTQHSRQQHFFKQNTSKIIKPNLLILACSLLAILALGFDMLNSSKYLIDLFSSYLPAKNKYVLFNFIKFIEFIFLFLAASNVFKYFYLEDLKSDSLKNHLELV